MITIAGTGPGDGRYALPRTREIAASCTLLAGYPRVLGPFLSPGKPIIDFSSDAEGLRGGLSRMDSLRHEEDICLLVSGDPGFHSLLGTVRRLYPRWDYEVLPGLSAFQVICAKIALPWQGMALISCHGTGEWPDTLGKSAMKQGAVILTDKERNAGNIARRLSAELDGRRMIWIGSDIGTDQESLIKMSLEETAGQEKWEGLCTIVMPPE